MTDGNAMPMRGSPAPEFRLPAAPDRQVSLTQLRGRPVVLAFYPADWGPVCSDQMALYQALMPDFERFGAAVLGVSVDGVWCHRAFAESRGLRFDLLSDFEPKGAVADRYGVYEPRCGMSERALFVMDADGLVVWSYVSPPAVNPGAEGILTALQTLNSERRSAS